MDTSPLHRLGWNDHFQRQLGADAAQVARISSIHRDRLDALGTDGALSLTLRPDKSMAMAHFAVGDWVQYQAGRVTAVLQRASVLARRAPGPAAERQLIAANLDTLAVVTSCNADFNTARIERYLAMARAGGVLPLVVLTKADVADPAPYIAELQREFPGIAVLALNALDPGSVTAALLPWAKAGQTLALAGSSGVGKTTIANALTAGNLATQAVRDDDAKGRHTTTARQMLPLSTGGWLIDTPGMRELQLTDAAQGLALGFADVAALAETCRFRNCDHESAPGCAVQAAVAAGALDDDRFQRWLKLWREDRSNSQNLAEAKESIAARGKTSRKVLAAKRARRGDFDLDGDEY